LSAVDGLWHWRQRRAVSDCVSPDLIARTSSHAHQ